MILTYVERCQDKLQQVKKTLIMHLNIVYKKKQNKTYDTTTSSNQDHKTIHPKHSCAHGLQSRGLSKFTGFNYHSIIAIHVDL